ncbi:MAG TPA: 16S rRNA (guanine(527)-N(7))-methyltransferase RsmG [Desulfobacteria bacterium]|nr:16S rRNA (guanine(527)-N(7))-methyltransferase RsmG [Desulfobacteria bacterium]
MTKSADLLIQGLAALGQQLDPQRIAQLDRYFLELKKWNRSINLVAAGPDEQLLENHFLDSLTLLPLLDPCPIPGLVDVGSGAGFPGLVLKIARPDLRVTLVEPRQKRTAFLRQVIRLAGLKGIEVMDIRLERESPEFATWREAIPLFVSRAFTAIAPFLSLCEPFSVPGGRVICMKGRKAAMELGDWHKQQPESRYTLTAELETALPFSGTPRKLLVFTKTPA